MDPAPPRLVLVAEAHPVVGLDLADALEMAGYHVVGPLRTAAAVEAWLAGWTPALAILDVQLAGRSSAAAARVLRGRRIPFLVHAAVAEGEALPDAFADAPRLRKPASTRDIVDLLGQLPQAAGTPH
jgi:DNA-binding NarL/FixJ family response regulator